jgi:16S rRNA (cytosine967-C5)-methyltransferase
VDESGDQTGAVNRSRPIFPRGPQVRWRRDGKPSAPPANWRPERGEDRGGARSNGPGAHRGHPEPGAHRGRPGPGPRVHEPRQESPPSAGEGPALPADPREAALRILHAVDTRSAFSDRLLDGAHARPGADPRDRALLHELVKGTLRWRARLDAALDARVHVGLANTQPWIRNILRLGAYQILFLDRVPAHAAVDESVKLAHKYSHPGAAGLVNSVLRRLAEERATVRWPEGDDAESLGVWGSHPLWIVERWLARFGPAQTRALLEADNRPVPTGLRVNTLKHTREELVEMLGREGVIARPASLSPDLVWVEGHHSPGSLHSFKAGLCTAQDESEALVARVVAPRPHERVLDLCAAPGGKSTHLAELMGDEGEVWALERDAHRVETLRATVERLGVHSVHVVHGDGRNYPFPMPFDRVLVDAPCSGLGVLARRADARWRKGPEVLAEMPPVQLDLLRAAARHLSPGGRLVYSVCSFEPEETDQVVARFLAEHPGWTLESAAGSVPDAVLTPEGTMLVLPHRHGCDGAFAARLRKP